MQVGEQSTTWKSAPSRSKLAQMPPPPCCNWAFRSSRVVSPGTTVVRSKVAGFVHEGMNAVLPRSLHGELRRAGVREDHRDAAFLGEQVDKLVTVGNGGVAIGCGAEHGRPFRQAHISLVGAHHARFREAVGRAFPGLYEGPVDVQTGADGATALQQHGSQVVRAGRTESDGAEVQDGGIVHQVVDAPHIRAVYSEAGRGGQLLDDEAVGAGEQIAHFVTGGHVARAGRRGRERGLPAHQAYQGGVHGHAGSECRTGFFTFRCFQGSTRHADARADRTSALRDLGLHIINACDAELHRGEIKGGGIENHCMDAPYVHGTHDEIRGRAHLLDDEAVGARKDVHGGEARRYHGAPVRCPCQRGFTVVQAMGTEVRGDDTRMGRTLVLGRG